jgi:prepilin-type N-terminal cleavage/methylation domain-containing protein
MLSTLIRPKIDRRAFTLVELLVSMAICAVVVMIFVSVLVTSMSLSSENAVTNLSNFRARQAIDRLNNIIRFAASAPTLINADGTTASGTTADGVMIQNALPGDYVFLNSNGNATADIPSGASTFMVQFSPSTGANLPKVGDHFVLTLASTTPDLEVQKVGAVTTSGSITNVVITTIQATAEIASPSSYTIRGARYCKEAYIFAQSGSSWTLRHVPQVVSTTSFSALPSNQLGVGFQKLANQAWFTTTTDGTAQCTWLRAIARSSDHAEYAETISGHTTLSTMPVQIKLWNYNAPTVSQ